MYLFQRRVQTDDQLIGETSESNAPLTSPPIHEIIPPLNSAAIQPGSAAEWAIGELLIRLCNGGRALRPDSRGEDEGR